MKFSEKVGNGPVNKWFNFGGDPGHRSGDPDRGSGYPDTDKTCLGTVHVVQSVSCVFVQITFKRNDICTVPVLLV